MRVFFLAVLLVLVQPQCDLRGVKPSECALYKTETFSCDGRTLQKSRINDDYCDCPQSGKDEPGTSACNSGKFWCLNQGFRGELIYSSRVDDGICDCCDGSDEKLGVCENNCKLKAVEEQSGLVEELEEYKQGLAARGSFNGDHIRIEKRSEIALFDGDLARKQQELETLRKEYAELEGKEKIRIEKETIEREAEEERQRIEEEAKQQEEGIVTRPNTESEVADVEAPDVASTPEDTESAEESTEEKKEENFPYPEEYRPKKDEEEKEENFPYPEEYRPKIETETGDDEQFEVSEEEDSDDEDAEEEEEEKPESDSILSTVSSGLKWAKNKVSGLFKSAYEQVVPKESKKIESSLLNAKNDEIRKIEREISDIESNKRKAEEFLSLNFGENNVYASLSGQCFSTKVDKYDYEVCFYKNSAQKEGGRSTSLGNFKTIEHDREHTFVTFSGGQSCWKGPQRSMKVKMICGKENKMLAATEPSMCSYAADFTTPVACRESKLKELTFTFDNVFDDEKNEL